jgi:hypothetical protein
MLMVPYDLLLLVPIATMPDDEVIHDIDLHESLHPLKR